MEAPLSAKEAAEAIGVDVERLRRWIKLGLVEISAPGGLGWREHRLSPAEVERLRVVAGLVDYGLTTNALLRHSPETRAALHEAVREVLEPTLLDETEPRRAPPGA